MRCRFLLVLLAFGLGCPATPPAQEGPKAGELPVQLGQPAVRVPRQPTDLGPAMTKVVGDGTIDGRALADGPATCEPCHADAVAQWRASGHAQASFSNPIYRVSVRGFRDATSNETSRFCAGCHDPALLIDGAMDVPVVASDPRAHAGVTCLTCHSISDATRDGNGSYTLRTDPVVMPVDGDPESLRAHRARLTMPALRTAEMCATCHRTFLGEATGHGHHMPGADDYGAWLSSSYAGNRLDRIDVGTEAEQAACRDCHMPLEAAPQGDRAADGGKLKSHRFMGGHTWLAAMRGDDVERVRAHLRGAATVDLVTVRDAAGTLVFPPEAAVLTPGATVELDVVVTNRRVGHRFPGGTLDMHDVWLEVVVEDAQGAVVASHGAGHTADATVADAHLFHAVVVDEAGRPVLARRVEHFRAVAYNTTIMPRDSVVVPYRFTVPTTFAAPLRVRTRLLHRSREPELARVACEDEERAAYEAVAPLDPCVAQPTTEIAAHTAVLGGGVSPAVLSLPLAERLLRHGTAWQHVLVEEIDHARPSLMAIVDELVADSPPARQVIGAAQHQLATVAARQGRIDEMVLWLGRARRNHPGHPALAFVQGQALASVWRFDEAIPWLRVAASGAPSDPRGWAALAIGLGSVGQQPAALAAAHQGMAYASRHPDLLRVQSLALSTWPAVPAEEVSTARAAFLVHRHRDDASELRSRCADEVPGCAVERTPAHHHTLLPRLVVAR